MAAPWTQAESDRLLELLAIRPLLAWSQIGAELGRSHGACFSKAKRLGAPNLSIRRDIEQKPGAAASPPPPATYEYGEEEASYSGVTTAMVQTEADLAAACEIDFSRWKVKSLQCKAYQMGSKDTDGNAHVTQLYSVSAKFVLREAIDPRREIQALADRMLQGVPSWPNIIPASAAHSPGRLLELVPADPHFGKYCWGPETGNDYDLDKALADFQSAIWGAVQRAAHLGPDSCLVVLGNDMFNSDNLRGETTAGTRQDQDTRYMRIFRLALDMVAGLIGDLRKQFHDVRIITVPGNHDTQTTQLFTVCLEAWHRNTTGVTFDQSMRSRKYHRHGSVLLGFAHGDREKLSSLPLVMAQECPEWSQTQWREWHTGHQHRTKSTSWLSTDEQTGVIVRSLSALSSTDAWHEQQGYVAARRGMESFVWDAAEGIMATYFVRPQSVADR